MSDLFTRAAASLAGAGRPIEAAEAPRLRNLAGRFSKALPVIKNLDAEQQLAVLTDGWVCVGAGAGSGKTTTLEARVKLLLQEGARPERILVVTFNRKAANEIRERLASSVSEVTLSMLRLGTMHSQFARWVQQYGTAAEKAAITTRLIRNDRSGRDAPTSRQLAGIMSRQWYECREDKPPRDASNLIQRWSVEGLTPAEAMKGALTKAELSAAVWYEWWLGFRGFLGRAWSPPCVTKRGQARWKEFLRRYRPTGGELLGEINDMVLLFGQIVKRDAAAVARIRQELDHILVDEGQDLNKVQHDIIGTLGADLGSAPRSLWIVGDERQSINAFVGASPKLFAELPRKGFKLRTIRTNYRCLPEIVEAANRLMEHQPSQLNIASRPDPGKLRGNARISVVSGLTHEESAQRVMASIRLALASGAEPARFAILARTNLELSAFESAAIVARVPYTRRGSASFLTSPEVAIVKGYLDFFAGDGEEERTQALAKIIDKPSRFFLRQGEGAIVVKKSLASIGRSARPGSLFDLLSSERGLAAIRAELRALPSWQEWQSDQVSEELGRMARQLLGIRAGVQQGKYSTRKLLDEILRIEGAPVNSGDERPTLGQTLLPFGGDDEDDTSTVQSSDMPIGNVQFFYLLLDDQPELQQPGAFVKHLGELAKNSNQLRYDADKWQLEQAALPVSQRVAVPAVTLSTVHSVKGLQWVEVYVEMATGIFPFSGRTEKGLTEEAEKELAARRADELLTERQLAYVALTRAQASLTIVSPSRNAFGKGGEKSRFIDEAGLGGLASVSAELPRLAEVIATTSAPPLQEVAEVQRDDEVQTAEAVIKRFGLGVLVKQTEPKKEGKLPRTVFEVRGNTQAHAALLKSLGGRYFAGAWSFFDDPTNKIASALDAQLAVSQTSAAPDTGGADLGSRGLEESVEEVDQPGVALACPPSVPGCNLTLFGRQCGIATAILIRDSDSQLKIPARYCLVEVEALIPSHVSRAHDVRSGIASLSERPDYPPALQERRYNTAFEAAKIDRIANFFDPAEIANQGSSAIGGPPIATVQLWVLGGNGRTLGTDAYYNAPEPAPGATIQQQRELNAATFKAFLRQNAPSFGFSAADVDKLNHPIVVRIVDTIAGRRGAGPRDLTGEERAELINLVRVFNRVLTQPIDAASQAVSQARALPVKALDYLATGIGDGTLSEYLTSSESEGFVLELKKAGVIEASDPQLFDGNLLSVRGREGIERLLAASLLPDANTFEAAGAELRKSLVQLAPYLLAAKAANNDFSIADSFENVTRDYIAYRATGQTLKNYLAQKSFGNLEPDRTGLHHLELLAFLAENVGSYRKLSTAARGYYLAAYAPKSPQQGLFSSQPESEEQAFARTFASSGSKTGIL